MTRKRSLVIIGGGISGLSVAQSLSGLFERVIVVERRRSIDASLMTVPQSPQGHLLLASGFEALTRIFPALGTLATIDPGLHTRWETEHGVGPRVATGMQTAVMDRRALDQLIAGEVAKNPKITLLNECKVIRLSVDDRPNEIRSVRVQSLRDGGIYEFETDALVDASGHQSQILDLLREVQVPTSNSDIDVHYATRHFRVSEVPDWSIVFCEAQPPHSRRSALLTKTGRETISVMLSVGGSNSGPRTAEEFSAFAKSLPYSTAARIIEASEAISPVYTFRRERISFRRFSAISELPLNLFPTGDAYLTLNPYLGRGMSTALNSALLLKMHFCALSAGEPLTNRDWFQSAEDLYSDLWAADLAFSRRWQPKGKPSYKGRLLRSLSRSAYQGENLPAMRAFYRILHMKDAPGSLLSPEILFRQGVASTISEIRNLWQEFGAPSRLNKGLSK